MYHVLVMVCQKRAIIYLTQNIALQVGGYNIRCNAVLPGMIATDAVKGNMSEQFNDMFLKHTVFNRMGEACRNCRCSCLFRK